MSKLINWKGIYKLSPLFHIYFTSRKRGKSDTKGWFFLEEIIKPNNTSRFAWIRRRWHDSLLSTKPFFEDLVAKFCEEYPNLNRNHFEIKERGLFYQGTKRIDFYDLFSYQRARGAIARTVYQEIVFEEAIPIDQEFLYVGGRTEQWMFKDLIDSLKGRKGKDGKALPLQTKITFLANPYLFSAWFLDVFKNIHKLRKLAEEKKSKNDNSGVLEIAKDEQGVEWLLYLNLIEGEYDAHSRALEEKINPSTVNWDDFMIDEDQMKKYRIVYSIQDFFFCELGERKVHKKYALLHFTKNTKQTDSTLINFCFDWEEVAKSKLKNCRLRKKEEIVKKWVKLLKEGMLRFRDYRGRDWFLGLIKGVQGKVNK
ncbi:hypothetical protein [endosymbiont GvMRE of Glomus versiforme]|nr:hypothetical protein [endosymbiont GvMRE of Glomus versiforme]RHZ37616.1 hypothetical protein GvMRE_I1g127 [endosymbiont GvMRE of Glomus versiforme]